MPQAANPRPAGRKSPLIMASGVLRSLPPGIWKPRNGVGAPATFLAGASFAAVAAFGLLAYRKPRSAVG